MKKFIFLFAIICFLACENSPKISFGNAINLNKEFKSYWFDGTAEISSYRIKKSRYGKTRDGETTLIYVTEDFLPIEQVKANKRSETTLPVLKLNRNTTFLTGIYPYHIMNSSFTHLGYSEPLIKITTSIQEWCGHVYLQLNKKEQFQIKSHSYFEGEADQKITAPIVLTEDEIWHLIRTQPDTLPMDKQLMLPGSEYLRLNHQKIQAHEAFCSLIEGKELSTYSINYPKIDRTLSITFHNTPPFLIEAWEERVGIAPKSQTYSQRIKTLKLPYWKLNQLGDERFRDSLGLK